jgi:hypothetical protein
MDRKKPGSSHEPLPPDSRPRKAPDSDDEIDDVSRKPPNPPRTTSHGITAPKFGSAGSGGAELEPGPERD